MKKCIIAIFVLAFSSTLAFAGEEYDLAESCIKGLQLIAINVEKANVLASTDYKDTESMAIDLLSESRLAVRRLEQAKNLFEKYLSSKNELVRETAEALIKTYAIKIAVENRLLEANEKLVASYGKNDKGEGLIERSKIQADGETAWEMMINGCAFVTHCLVDQKPDKNGNLSYLVLTSAERKELIKELDSIYGKSIKNGMQAGQTKFEVCGAGLRAVLAGDHKSADQRKDKL